MRPIGPIFTDIQDTFIVGKIKIPRLDSRTRRLNSRRNFVPTGIQVMLHVDRIFSSLPHGALGVIKRRDG
jgi:hypothetical protein